MNSKEMRQMRRDAQDATTYYIIKLESKIKSLESFAKAIGPGTCAYDVYIGSEYKWFDNEKKEEL